VGPDYSAAGCVCVCVCGGGDLLHMQQEQLRIYTKFKFYT